MNTALAREVFERDYLIAQISRFSGNISRTAEFVGMERSAHDLLHRCRRSAVLMLDLVRRKENVMIWLSVFHAIRMVVFLHLLKGEPIRQSLARGFHNFKGLIW